MTVYDLNREQLTELKQAYYSELVNEGTFGEIIGRDYVIGRDYDEPSYYDLAMIDEIISDEFIYEHYDGYIFTEDDFFCTCSTV